MVRRARVLVGWGILASAAAATGGCGWILGLDEFTDRPAGAAGGAGGGGCTSAQECPTGEHGSPTCEAGVCGFACADGFANCDEAVGCEAPTDEDKQNCGGCGVSCAAFCVEGSCNDPVDISVGHATAYAILKDGSLWFWGAEPVDQYSVNTVTTPTLVALPERAVQVEAGGIYPGFEMYTCVLLADKTVRCWGNNMFGELGVGDADLFVDTPTDVGLQNIKQISIGGTHTCAVDEAGALFCWGYNDSGAVGDGTTQTAFTPAEVTDSVALVSAGGTHTCALMSNGSFRCWGLNNYGQIGVGSEPEQLVPTALPSPIMGLDVACGGHHSCARNLYGSFCWGLNSDGQLGLGHEVNQQTPAPLDLPGITAIALGSHHTAAVVDGELYMWGENSYGQLGDGTAVSASTPKKIGLSSVKKVALGFRFSCALDEAGVVRCWGLNGSGQLGNGNTNGTSVPTPVVWP